MSIFNDVIVSFTRRLFKKRTAIMVCLYFCTINSVTSQEDDILEFLPAVLSKLSNNTSNIPPNNDQAVNLCFGFDKNDKSNRPMGQLTRPAPLESYIDPNFGSSITRITNSDAINSGIARTMYSTIQAWNADESKLILWHREEGHFLYDGTTYELIERLPIVPADIEQVFWSRGDSNIFIYPNKAVGSLVDIDGGVYRLKGNELLEYNIATKFFRVIKDFNSICSAGAGITGGNDVQMPSYDDDLIGLRCDDLAFTYRVSTEQVTILSGQGLSATAKLYAPQPFPSGDRSYHYDTVRNEFLETQTVFFLGRPDEHANVGRLHDASDAYFSVAFNQTTNGACQSGVGSIVVHEASSGDCRVLVGQDTGYPYTLSGTHISALANKNPGWVLASSVGYGVEGDSLLEQELYLANTDESNPQVCRIAHHRSSGRHGQIGYFAEPHPVLSPSGTRVLFNSDWNDSGQVDVYVIELPSYN